MRQCSGRRRSPLFLQTPEVQDVLQTAEEPEQRGEEQGGAGRSPRQRLQGAAAAPAASGRRPVINANRPQLICGGFARVLLPV